MNSSPNNQHFSRGNKKKSVQNIRTLTVLYQIKYISNDVCRKKSHQRNIKIFILHLFSLISLYSDGFSNTDKAIRMGDFDIFIYM